MDEQSGETEEEEVMGEGISESKMEELVTYEDALWRLSSSSVVVCNTNGAILRVEATSPAQAKWWSHVASSLIMAAW